MGVLDLGRYRVRAEEFIGALDLELYEHYSGRKPVCDTAAVYDRYPDLFTRETIAGLESRYRAADDDKTRLAYLLAFAVDGYLGEETKHLADEMANIESTTTITVDDETIGLRQAGVAQANEADRARRSRIQAARLEATAERLNPVLTRLWRRCHELAEGLGYPSYKALHAETKGIDYDHLRAEVDGFLVDTSSLYERSMDALVRERLGFGLDALSYADLPYLWRAPEYDGVFTAEGLLPTLHATLEGLGIDLEAQPNVHLDTEVRPLKSPRAFCAPVRIPEEIYLVVLPQGGQEDYAALLHESGHTEHYAHVAADLAFEFRHLGDYAVTEAFAFTLDHLIVNREWLAHHLDYVDSDEYVRFATVSDLYFMRRYAAKLAYETVLHDAGTDAAAMPAEYSRRLSDATMVTVPPENHLVDVDDGLYCASYLRAWMLEGALRLILQERFGPCWFREAGAGAWLRELWSLGQELTAERLLLRHGGGRLSADPLRRLFERALAD